MQHTDDNGMKYIFFWRPFDKYGIYGQWWKSDFVLTKEIYNEFPDEIRNLKLLQKKKYAHVMKWLIGQEIYTSAEKFMMMGKAALFKDEDIFGEMSTSDNPKTHRALGRKVRNFRDSVWKKYSCDIVVIGNYLKFQQNDELMSKMLDTHDCMLVEASPYDRIWGIGLKYDDPRCLKPELWKGVNNLGECLMFVRNILL